MTDLDKTKFENCHDHKLIDNFITKAKEQKNPLILWKDIGDQRFTTKALVKITRINKKEFVIVPFDHNKQDDFFNLIGDSIELNFYLPAENIFFKSDIKIYRDDRIIIHIPEYVAMVDKRKHLRLFMNDDVYAKIGFSKKPKHKTLKDVGRQTFTKECLDLSEGGLSFIISKTEIKYFSIGDNMKNIDIYLNHKHKITLSGVIRHIVYIGPNKTNQLNYGGHKVSLQFKDVKDEITDTLRIFIFGHKHLNKNVV